MYAVVYQNRVIVGPMDWNRAIFQGSLAQQGIYQTLPRVAPEVMPYRVSEESSIYSVEERRSPLNPLVEYYYGPLWEITDSIVIANYQTVDSPIDAARSNLKGLAAEERWRKEIAGVFYTLQGQQVWLDTSRDGRSIFVQALMLIADGQSINWKFPQGWFQLSKPELEAIVAAGAAHIQSCFDWEKTVCEQLDAATSKSELLAVEIVATSVQT